MKRLNEATKQEIEALKTAARILPEMHDEYLSQAYGVFALWLNLKGFHPTEENAEIAAMRDYCTRW